MDGFSHRSPEVREGLHEVWRLHAAYIPGTLCSRHHLPVINSMDAERPGDAYGDEKSARSEGSHKHGPTFDKNAVDTAAVLTAGADLTVDPAVAAKLRCV